MGSHVSDEESIPLPETAAYNELTMETDLISPATTTDLSPKHELVHHDLRTQSIPTLEIITEEEEAVASTITPKPSVASLGQRAKLSRKSTVSFVLVEKPSTMSVIDENLAPVSLDDLVDTIYLEIPIIKFEGDSETFSSTSTVKKVSFEDVPAATALIPVKEITIASPSRVRQSLNIYTGSKEASAFKEQAAKTQSLDLRRDETPSYSSQASINKIIAAHSGPIDHRAVTVMRPALLMEKIIKIVEEMGLEYVHGDDPFKLVVLRSSYTEDSDDDTTPRDSPDLNRRNSNMSKSSRQTSRSTKKNGRFMSSIFQKIRYISTFGFQYNKGFDGTHYTIPPPSSEIASDPFVKFHIVIRRIRSINGVYIIDLKRYKGDIWEFKRIYNEVVTRLDLKGESQ